MFASNNTTIEEKAEKTFMLLAESLISGKFISHIIDTYQKGVEGPIANTFGIGRKEPFNIDDTKRIILEIVSFATFLLMMNEAPKYIQKRTALFNKSPDAERVRYYNTILFALIDEYLDSNEYKGVHEIIVTEIHPEIKFEEGEVIDLASRIKLYIDSGDIVSTTELFAHNLSLAIDRHNVALTELISLHFANSIIDWTKDVAKNVFA